MGATPLVGVGVGMGMGQHHNPHLYPSGTRAQHQNMWERDSRLHRWCNRPRFCFCTRQSGVVCVWGICPDSGDPVRRALPQVVGRSVQRRGRQRAPEAPE